jgi:hypothetical protein
MLINTPCHENKWTSGGMVPCIIDLGPNCECLALFPGLFNPEKVSWYRLGRRLGVEQRGWGGYWQEDDPFFLSKIRHQLFGLTDVFVCVCVCVCVCLRVYVREPYLYTFVCICVIMIYFSMLSGFNEQVWAVVGGMSGIAEVISQSLQLQPHVTSSLGWCHKLEKCTNISVFLPPEQWRCCQYFSA